MMTCIAILLQFFLSQTLSKTKFSAVMMMMMMIWNLHSLQIFKSSHLIQGVSNDVCLFGNIIEKLREICISMGIHHFQNKANEYPETKREYSEVNRFFNPSTFTRVLKNGEVVTRDWLVYSSSKTSVFCFPCILFSSEGSIKLCASGDNDWKNINQL